MNSEKYDWLAAAATMFETFNFIIIIVYCIWLVRIYLKIKLFRTMYTVKPLVHSYTAEW